MSQRGSCPTKAHQTAHIWWATTRTSLAFALTILFGTTLTLTAQTLPLPSINTHTVTLRVDGTVRQVETSKATVQLLLHQEDVSLDPHDLVAPPLSTPITDHMVVTVSRVTFEICEERIAVPPPVVTRWDRRMTVKPVVLREGRPGVAVQKRCLWKKDGVVTVQWTQGKRIVTQPRPTVVVRGNIPSRAGISGRRTLTMVATAYDPGPRSCGRFATGRTAIGMRAGRGVIAVDPRVIPLGSRVYVEGYGPAIAGDVGGAIKGNIIDVCFPTRDEALRWGRRRVSVVVYE